MALEDAAEVPARETQARGRLERAHRRGAREFIQGRHVAEEATRADLADLLLLAVAILNDLDTARADDEHAHARVALAHDLLAGLPLLLDRGVRDLAQGVVVQLGEERDVAQKFD